MKRYILFLLIILSAVGSVFASSLKDVDLSPYFKGCKQATFVLYDETADAYTVFNDARSSERFSPCSTFKIYNSLVGLETGNLSKDDADTFEKWDGTKYSFPDWNRDQTLSSATKYSVVWYFQRLAQRIGTDMMQAFVDVIGYGNCDISGGLTTFWLGSSLKISAREQVELLRKLFSGKLPVTKESAQIVIKNITLASDGGTVFIGKTGSDGQGLGWFVGCVEKDENRYFFALNIQADGGNGKKAKDVVRTILKDMGICDV